MDSSSRFIVKLEDNLEQRCLGQVFIMDSGSSQLSWKSETVMPLQSSDPLILLNSNLQFFRIRFSRTTQNKR